MVSHSIQNLHKPCIIHNFTWSGSPSGVAHQLVKYVSFKKACMKRYIYASRARWSQALNVSKDLESLVARSQSIICTKFSRSPQSICTVSLLYETYAAALSILLKGCGDSFSLRIHDVAKSRARQAAIRGFRWQISIWEISWNESYLIYVNLISFLS